MIPLVLPVLVVAVASLVVLVSISLSRPRRRAARAHAVPADESRLGELSMGQLSDLVAVVFEERGYGTLAEASGETYAELVLERPEGAPPRRLYVRSIAAKRGPVSASEVRWALEAARGEQLEKVVLVTPGSFSNEAREAARSAAVELIDGRALEQLVRASPQLAERFGLLWRPPATA